eukprot:jgi/Mesen1/2394/ME000157S01533
MVDATLLGRSQLLGLLLICGLPFFTSHWHAAADTEGDAEWPSHVNPADIFGFEVEGVEKVWGGNITKLSNFADEIEGLHNISAAFDSEQTQGRKLSSCSYTAGRWVKDSSRPKYSGRCKWIRSAFNCQANGRRVRDYEKYSWKPYDCNMRAFDPAYYLALTRNKIVSIVGDSFSRNFAQAMICQINARTSVKLWSGYVGGVLVGGVIMPAYNSRLVTVVAPYLVEYTNSDAAFRKHGLHPGDGNDYLVTLDRADTLWAGALKHFDITIFMSGHWFLTNQGTTAVRSTTYLKGGRVQRGLSSARAYAASLAFLRRFVTVSQKYRGVPFWLTYSPSHYTPGHPPYCNAQKPASLAAVQAYERRAISTSFAALEKAELRNSQFRIVDVTHISAFRADAHVSRFYGPVRNSKTTYDCTHWCLPGMPDIWVDTFQYVLQTQLRRAQASYKDSTGGL